MKGQKEFSAKRVTVALVACIALALMLIGPTAVLAKADTQAGRNLHFTPRLTTVERDAGPAKKFGERARDIARFRSHRSLKEAYIPAPKVSTASHTLRTTSGTTVSTGSSGSSGSTSSSGSSSSTGSGDEQAQAQAILNRYIAQYPILAGTTVSFGTTPGGHQAVAYYTVGRILISPTHTASLERIIGHEIWHIIDYRDNGRIDWGENVPPSNYP
ncbi:MAG: hypothetical protein Kow0056_10750 [Coriobacteriia bacterium]